MPRRWYERPGLSIEQEVSEFEADELAFSLDREQLDGDGSVVFRGYLRLGERRVPAEVLYPPAYDDAHPVVVAPQLPVGRHVGRGGALCLDHPVLGQTASMSGAEAVKLAENLWWYWENDRDALRAAEADAADPRASQLGYEPKSAIVLCDLDIGDGQRGVLRVGLGQLKPARGAVAGVRVDEPDRGELPVAGGNTVFAGPITVVGPWQRIDDRPPIAEAPGLVAWTTRFQSLARTAVQIASVHRQVTGRGELPAMFAIVYRDEGPDRDQWHDEWLIFLIEPDDFSRPARTFQIRSAEAFVRQPHLADLGSRSVGVVGLGALGSPLTTALARAGTGRFALVDSDIVDAGNRVRHDLDLASLGVTKVEALGRRLQRVNPHANWQGFVDRFGETAQSRDDEIYGALAETDLIINATANEASGYHIAAAGRAAGVPVLHTWVSAGAWGGRVLLQHEHGGCPQCLALHQANDSPLVPDWPEDQDAGETYEQGCAAATFTGTGFDISDVAATAARVAVAVLLDDAAKYPTPDGNLFTVTLRDKSSAQPFTHVTNMAIHPTCPICATG